MPDVIAVTETFIAFNKAAAQPVQADKTGDESLLEAAMAHFGTPLHLVHRIDRPVSGLVLLARSTAAMTALSRQFQEGRTAKTYLALVQNRPPQDSGRLHHYLRSDTRRNKTLVFGQPEKGAQEALLDYTLLGSSEHYHLLEIQLITGRQHQIRAQLAAIGCPIKGDVKYGARRANPDRSIHLHAWRLSCFDPESGAPVTLEAPLPDEALWQWAAKQMER